MHERLLRNCLTDPQKDLPFDLDTTSLALTVVEADKVVVSAVMTEMLRYLDGDGIIQVNSVFSLTYRIT